MRHYTVAFTYICLLAIKSIRSSVFIPKYVALMLIAFHAFDLWHPFRLYHLKFYSRKHSIIDYLDSLVPNTGVFAQQFPIAVLHSIQVVFVNTFTLRNVLLDNHVFN